MGIRLRENFRRPYLSAVFKVISITRPLVPASKGFFVFLF